VIDVATRRDQTVAVFGLGGSGIAAACALAASGATVRAWDDSAASRDRAARKGVPLADLYAADWSKTTALVLAPGIPLTHRPHRVVALARAAGCPIVGDIELLVEACPDNAFIGVTGTNGKSSTTALIGHVLGQAGRDVRVGGNLGPPALGFAPPGRDSVFVLELSSYQLDLTERASFDIAVLVNVSPDHLDRHGGMSGYVAAKKRIFRDRTRGEGGQTAVIGVDDAHGETIADAMRVRPGWTVIPVSATRMLANGVYVSDGALYDSIDGAGRRVCTLDGIATLPGTHNRQNAAAAYAAARAVGVAPQAIAAALATYPGLPHRIETIATIGGVRYVNDSKATNADATVRALACFDPVYWIAGGLAKDGGLAGVEPYLPRVRHAFLIGAAEEAFSRFLDGRVAVSRCGDLATALAEAHRMAQDDRLPGAVVLLSPACASFDQWVGFEARGDAFREMVRAVAREAPA
jgi:UDP-N-acetylmuramoylalanine--D-glutamate ligase